MPCHDYQEGAVYFCEDCGIEIQILKGCQECCGDHNNGDCDCRFECCGKPLTKKD